jgi:glycosyltransferase involved in cell wall biosynthesis
MARVDHPTISKAAGRVRAPSILQVLPALVTGGVERGAIDVAKAVAASGWNAYVASEGGHMVRELERAGVRHLTLPMAAKNPFVMRANVHRLLDVIETHGIDLVHARSRAPAWSARAAARRKGLPFVTTVHGTYGAGNPLKRFYNSIMTKGDRVIAISQFIADHAQATYGVDPNRVVVVPRGLDLNRFDPAKVTAERMALLANTWRLADGVPVVLLPGRLTRWKGQMVLIEAMARLVKDMGHDQLFCLLVGDDQGRAGYRRQLESAVRRLGLGSVVRLVGECRDMSACYMLADVVVSASTEPEAFGRVIAEAQAMGRPVIATDLGAARETVRVNESGWLVPPGDPAALAKALHDVLRLGPQKRHEMALAARRNIAERFTVERMCEQTLAVYSELLGRGR